MLTIDCGGSRDCSGLSRRDFLQIGTLGLGGLSLAGLLAQRSIAAEQGTYIKPKSVVLLFLGGGASHIETFNPNMGAPAPYSSVTGEVATPIPGVSFGGTFPGLAQRAKHLAVVRTFQHSIGSHPDAIVHVMSGGTNPTGKKNDRGFSMGSMYAQLRGNNHPVTGLPTHVLLTAPETDSQFRTEKGRVTAGVGPGMLGPSYSPFDPSGSSTALENMRMRLTATRLEDRRSLLHQLDRINREIDASGAMSALDAFEQQAIDLVLRGADKAFDLTGEDPRLVERYDTSMFQIGNKKRRPEAMRQSTLGMQMLLARRLCEAGCGYITVQAAGWDNHADGNNPGIYDGMEMLGRPLDKAVSAFLDDLQERRMLDDVLLVITGDFGRTPRINKNGGRDHWANLCTLAFAGGGLKLGQVIGQSARQNDVPATEPIGPGQLMSTIMHTLFDVPTLRLARGVPSDLSRLIESTPPIPGLL